MVGHAVRVVGADVGEAEFPDQELGELEDFRAEIIDLFGEMSPASSAAIG